MDVLALADVHGDQRVIDRVRMLLSKRKFDAVFFLGDLRNDGSVNYAQEFFEPLENTYAVPGNMDRQEVVEFMEKTGLSVHNRMRKLGRWKVIGYGGSHHVGRVPFANSEAKIIGDLETLGIDGKTILLTHMPPKGCFDMVEGENIGSPAIRKAVEEKKPFINVCGHVHEHEGEQMVGDTIVVSVGAAKDLRAAVISIDKREVDVDFINL